MNSQKRVRTRDPVLESAGLIRQPRASGASIAAGFALGSGLIRPGEARAAALDDPIPIPGGSPALGGGFHIFGPSPDGSFDPIDAEPCSITNFNGVVGLAYVDGLVTRIFTIVSMRSLAAALRPIPRSCLSKSIGRVWMTA